MHERVPRELRVGSAHDPAEAEADRVAEVVVRRMRRPDPVTPTTLGDASGWTSDATRRLFDNTSASDDPSLRRIHRSSVAVARPLTETSPRLQRSSNGRDAGRTTDRDTDAAGPDGGPVSHDTAARIRRSSGRGAPIDAAVRPGLEQAFGSSFGDVGIHANSSLPAEVGAIAFTHGRDIHFGPGQYQPDTAVGMRTLSHELTHVVQQGGAQSPTVHRLMSSKQFQETSKESFYQVHGKTMTEIDSVLLRYDALKVRGQHMSIGANGIDQAISLMGELQKSIGFWQTSHAQDKGRQKQAAAIRALALEVAAEDRSLRQTRAEAVTLGLATGDVQMQENKFVQKMEGSASSIFDTLSPIVGMAVPSPGDTADLEVTVKIPVDASSASYVGFTLAIGIQRQDRATTKISLNAAVNGGVQIMGVADLGLELGAFIEAQGKDPKAALQMISWGWYRRFRESVLPREVASFMWGGSTGSVGYKRSETWAANVEKENFSDDPKGDLSSGVGSGSTTNAYVRTGAYGSAAASGTIKGIAEMEGSAKLSGGTHYDKTTIEDRKGKRGGSLGKAEAMPVRGKTEYLGTRFLKLEAGVDASVGPFSGSLSGGVEWLTDQKTKKMRLEYLSATLSAGATIPLGATMGNQIANGIIKLGPYAANLIKLLATKASAEDPSGTPENLGQLVATGEGLAAAFGAFPSEAFDFTDFSIADEATKTLGEQLQEGASLGDALSTMSIGISIGKSLWQSGEPIAIDVTLNSEQGISFDASIVGLTATRTRRLLRIRYSAKKWQFD